MGVRNLLGKIGHERGQENEARALRVLTSRANPDWVTSFVKASFEEDQDGIDIIIHSDVGKLFLQIKSSETGRMNAKNPKNKAIVVISARMDDEEVHDRIIAAVASVRHKFKAQRGDW